MHKGRIVIVSNNVFFKYGSFFKLIFLSKFMIEYAIKYYFYEKIQNVVSYITSCGYFTIKKYEN